MYSFLPTQQTPSLVLFNIFLLFLLFLTLKEALEPPHIVSLAKYRFALILCVIFCLFSFWGTDWFNYFDFFPNLQSGDKGHMEDVYVWIARNLSPNYLIFRLIIWGGAFYLFILILKSLDISEDLVLLFFVVYSIIWFSYTRATIAMTIAFLGGSIMYRKEKHFLSFIIGSVLLFVSTYFHKSAMFVIPIVYMAYLFDVNAKLALRLTILLLPIIVVYANSFVDQLMLTDIDNTTDNMFSEYMISGQHYLSYEKKITGLGAIIRNVLERTPYYIIAFLGFKTLASDWNEDIPFNIRSFIIIQILIVVFSSVLLFDFNGNTQILYVRFLRYDAIPTVIVMAYLYELGIYSRIVDASIYIAGFGSVYSLLYALYVC